jgi:hypothetical protein
MFELKTKAFAGNPGEDVVVDIERDGQRMQLVLPRGPIGLTGQQGRASVAAELTTAVDILGGEMQNVRNKGRMRRS